MSERRAKYWDVVAAAFLAERMSWMETSGRKKLVLGGGGRLRLEREKIHLIKRTEPVTIYFFVFWENSTFTGYVKM